MKCRHCKKELNNVFVDLGGAPPSNSFLTEITIKELEKWYPLKVFVCESCWLVQTEDFVDEEEMFSEDYTYFSSFSSSWNDHAKHYVEQMTSRFDLTKESMVVEVAANDGYLLRYVQEKNIPCYGIEPTHSTAQAAREKGIKIFEEFFGVAVAKRLMGRGLQADLMVANNVLAHVPDINDFVKGFSMLLKPNGVATFENPHLLNLVDEIQFDTIYHEHYSYLSLTSVSKIFQKNGLVVFDVEELRSHGGSLRYYAQRLDTGSHQISKSVRDLQEKEGDAGMGALYFYQDFQKKADKIKDDLLSFLIDAKKNGKKVVAYGAAAKGNTLLNYAGVRQDLLTYVVDLNPVKQGRYMPGSRIPIVAESMIKEDKPEYILILPWNLKNEIISQLGYSKEWGVKFVTAIPEISISSC